MIDLHPTPTPYHTTHAKVLLATDDRVIGLLFQKWLADQPYCYTIYKDFLEVRHALETQTWDVVISDLGLPSDEGKTGGLAVVRYIKQKGVSIASGLMTVHGAQGSFAEAVALGVERILLKPFGKADFLTFLDKLDQTRRNREALAAAHQAIETQHHQLQSLRERDLKLGTLAQKYLLFKVPSEAIAGLSFACRAVGHDGASGDLIDVRSREGGLDVISGDVMGKGLGPAMVSAGIKTALIETYATYPHADLISRFTALRQMIVPMLKDMGSLLTLLMARVDVQQGCLTWIDCGAPSLLLWRSMGHVVFCQGDMMPLGIMEEPITQMTLPLYPHDRIILITDGVLDGLGLDNTRDALATLARYLVSLPHQDEPSLCDALVSQPLAEGGVADDKAVLVITQHATPDHPKNARQTAYHSVLHDLAQLPVLRAFAQAQWQHWLQDYPLLGQSDWIAHLDLAMGEVTANILRHAQPQDAMAEVGLLLSVDVEGVWVEWHYRALPFRMDHHQAVLPKTDDMAQSGYGLYLIQTLFDKVHYFTEIPYCQTILAQKLFTHH